MNTKLMRFVVNQINICAKVAQNMGDLPYDCPVYANAVTAVKAAYWHLLDNNSGIENIEMVKSQLNMLLFGLANADTKNNHIRKLCKELYDQIADM